MKYLTILMGLLLVASLACGPPPSGGETARPCRPHGLNVETDDGAMTVSWKADCTQLISGYNIYISPSPLMSSGPQAAATVKPYNDVVYPGDTNPNDDVETYDAVGLDNGVIYYVSVCVVYPDGSLSAASKEVPAVCGPRGEIELAVRYSSQQDGFSFEQNQYVRADNLANDLYFYSKDGVDYLAAPARLGGFLRGTRFKRLDKNETLTGSSLAVVSPDSLPTQDQVAVRKGDRVWLYSPEGHHALLTVEKVSDTGEGRTIRLSYQYWPVTTAPTP